MISRKSTPTRNNNHHHHHHRRRQKTKEEEEEEKEEKDETKCTGKACKSCAAHCIADCVAICCCPCAVINLLVFAFLKVPWTVGKRILNQRKIKRRKRKRDKIINRHPQLADRPMVDQEFVGDGGGGICRSVETARFEFAGGGGSGSGSGGEMEMEMDESLKKVHSSSNSSYIYEEEELFFELCQDFYLGFGRLSLSSSSDVSSASNTN